MEAKTHSLVVNDLRDDRNLPGGGARVDEDDYKKMSTTTGASSSTGRTSADLDETLEGRDLLNTMASQRRLSKIKR
jgi:hypothetical protein